MVLWVAVGGVLGVLVFALIAAVALDTDGDGAAADGATGPGDGPRGEEVADAFGCTACHTTDGSDFVGPTWQGVAGARREFEDGTTAVADRGYLRESIVNPSERIVAGFDDVMPKTYQEDMSRAEINAVIDYIETLG